MPRTAIGAATVIGAVAASAHLLLFLLRAAACLLPMPVLVSIPSITGIVGVSTYVIRRPVAVPPYCCSAGVALLLLLQRFLPLLFLETVALAEGIVVNEVVTQAFVSAADNVAGDRIVGPAIPSLCPQPQSQYSHLMPLLETAQCPVCATSPEASPFPLPPFAYPYLPVL